MDQLSKTAFAAYRDLVYGTDGFKEFFRQLTPIQEISGLKIGSRPASRTKSTRIEDLRAIPWVFSWAQARVMLPRSEEHTSELLPLMRISYAVFCVKKKKSVEHII